MEELARYVFLDFVQMQAWTADPLVIESGDGVYVTDTHGKRYIDGLSGIFTMNLGYGNRAIATAVADQVLRLPFNPQMATNERTLELAALMREIAPRFTHMKFLSGGSEATEAAIKIARQYHRQTGNPTKYKVVSHYRGYHGGTGHALAATGWAKWKDPFEPLPAGFVHVHTPDPYRPPFPAPAQRLGDVYASLVEETIRLEGPDTVAAIIVEPVLMSAGVIVPPDGYLQGLRAIADRYNVLLILDEVITGFGRTGTLFCCEQSGVWPDIMCCGKGMSAGYAPLSAVLMTERIAAPFWGNPDAMVQYHAGHTYAGNPVACAAGIAAVTQLVKGGVLPAAVKASEHLRAGLVALAARHNVIGDVRGRGMLLGLEFVRDHETRERFPDSVGFGTRLAAATRKRGLLLRASAWFAAVGPPLTISIPEVDALCAILDDALQEVSADVTGTRGRVAIGTT
jgi:adenosylmethionine-8-amino-7-oxononanoate aminotransferase